MIPLNASSEEKVMPMDIHMAECSPPQIDSSGGDEASNAATHVATIAIKSAAQKEEKMPQPIMVESKPFVLAAPPKAKKMRKKPPGLAIGGQAEAGTRQKPLPLLRIGIPAEPSASSTKVRKLGGVFMEPQTLELEHVQGCLSAPGTVLEQKPLPDVFIQLIKDFRSEDNLTKFKAIHQALKMVETGGVRSADKPAIMAHLAAALDSITDDMERVFMSLPDIEPGKRVSNCVYLRDVPTLRAEIGAHLKMSPKFALENFTAKYLDVETGDTDEIIAQVFVDEVIQNCKCYQELDGLKEMDIRPFFQAVWDRLSSDQQDAVRLAYQKREGFWHMEKSIAEIVGVPQ